MHFDDRLGTVLRLNAQGDGLRRIQMRQLLDLLGTMPADIQGAQVDAAYSRIAELSKGIAPAERVTMLRDAGLRLRSPRLVAALAESEAEVASAAISRAELSEEQWLDLIPALPLAARGHVRRRRDLGPQVEELLTRLGIRERGLPPAEAAVAETAQPAPEPIAEAVPTEPEGQAPEPTTPEPAAAAASAAPDEAAPVAEVIPMPAPRAEDGIGALVRRIEAYRRARQVVDHAPSADSPRLPLGEEHVLAIRETKAFDFATDAAGRIVWSDPGVAPMVTGMTLSGNEEIDGALRRRQPLRGQMMELVGAPAISGPWRIDAGPWFDPLTGRHVGWRGRMRRPAEPGLAAGPQALPPVKDSQADRIRQMLHELRTPVNAIQGFAEVIQQQLFGPTPHEYRAHAASIAGDAARMLAAFEELERLAKLDSGALDLADGETDLVAVVEATIAQLAAHTRQRSSGFDLKIDDQPLIVPLARIEVERVIWRLLATLAGVCAPGEMLKTRLRAKGGNMRLDVTLPASLADRSQEDLLKTAAGAVPQVIAAGVFGIGFALRLVTAEAKAAGGQLSRKDDRLRLTLPGLTANGSGHSHGATEELSVNNSNR